MLTIHVANALDPISIDSLQEFINMTVPLIPKHLAKRFKALLRKFMAADPADPAGQLSLVNGVFYYANVEVNHLALIRRTQTAAPIGSEPAVRVEIDESMVYVGYVVMRLAGHVDADLSKVHPGTHMRNVEDWRDTPQETMS